MTKIVNAGTTITDVIGGILFVIFFLEMCIGTTLTVHLPPPRVPWFMKPPAIIIPMPRNPYENDTWRNTWEQRDG